MARTRNQAAYQAKRHTILRAAESLFATRGFHNTGIAAICEAVGMSPGALYRYFSSKDDIIEAIVEEERASYATWFAGVEQADDIVAALVDGLDAALAEVSDPTYAAMALEIAAEGRRNARVGASLATALADLQGRLRDALAHGRERGHVTSDIDVDVAAALLLAVVDGSVEQGLIHHPAVARRAALNRMVRGLLTEPKAG